MVDWLLVPRNGAILNWTGFLFGALGIVLGLIGLWIALKQLSAIKTESEAATVAIKNVQLKVASLDTAQECQVAKSLIASLRSNLIEYNWLKTIKDYEELIQSFLRLSHSNSSIAEEDRALLVKMTRDMARMCDGIRKKQQSGVEITMHGQDQALRDFSDIMTKITFLVIKDIQQ